MYNFVIFNFLTRQYMGIYVVNQNSCDVMVNFFLFLILFYYNISKLI